MADHVQTVIRQAFKYGLEKKIVKGEKVGEWGYVYKNTFKDVNDPPKSPQQIKEFPAVNITVAGEEVANLSDIKIQAGQNEAKIFCKFLMVLDCFAVDVNDPQTTRENMKGDIQAYFGNYYWIPKEANWPKAKSCFTCIYAGDDPFSLDVNGPKTGITVRYMIWYRYKLTDPTQLG